MPRLRGIVIGAFGTGGLVMAGAVFALSATPASHVMTFIDRTRGVTLTIELEAARSDAGHFIVQVAGHGAYSGVAGAAMRVLTPTSVVVNYHGPAILRDLKGSGPTTPQLVTVSLGAQVDPAHHTAEATLDDGRGRYHLVVAAAGKADLEKILAGFETAMSSDNGAALYDVMSSDYTSRQTKLAFAQEWANQSPNAGRFTSLQRTDVGPIQTDDLGFTTVTASYSAMATLPGGISKAVTFNATFVQEASGWKLWFTTAPQ